MLAHPFATRSFAFSVMGEHTLWWGGCAWDAFAIPNLVPDEPSALIATTCPACGTAHSWNVTREGPPEGAQVAHFLTPMAHVWDDVIHACEHQRIFCDEACVDRWLAETGGGLLLVSQFTLAADTKKGMRPGFSTAAAPEEAQRWFARLVDLAKTQHPRVEIGRFGGRRSSTVNPVAWLTNSRAPPSCLARERIMRMPRPPSASGSKSCGKPTPSSQTRTMVDPSGKRWQSKATTPGAPAGWAYLTALVTASPTTNPTDSAICGRN